MPTHKLIYGVPCLQSLKTMADKSVHMVCTSPPYWGLRDYEGVQDVVFDSGHEECQHSFNTNGFCDTCGSWRGSLGQEPDPDLFVDHLVEIFREVRRVLRDDGTLWINIGDSYMSNKGYDMSSMGGFSGKRMEDTSTLKAWAGKGVGRGQVKGLKQTDLVGVPWMLAFALRRDGWFLRQDIIWAKGVSGEANEKGYHGNPMPESTYSRCNKAHEYVFLLSKSRDYFFDYSAIRDDAVGNSPGEFTGKYTSKSLTETKMRTKAGLGQLKAAVKRNRRSVWTVSTKALRENHFAAWPEKLVEPMILAGTSEKGCCSACRSPHVRVTKQCQSCLKTLTLRQTVCECGETFLSASHGGLYQHDTWAAGCSCGAEVMPCTVMDIFSGSGTTGKVARELGRNYIGLDISSEYLNMAEKRVAGPQPMEF